jgi:molybdopterin synthase sulfur carrier subunit
MPVVFVIPGALRPLADNRDEVRIEGSATTLAGALARLWTAHPALRDRVMTEAGDVRPHINIFVDGANAREIGGLDAAVGVDAEVVLLPAVSGG